MNFVGLWACACATCLLLAVNRCLALIYPLLSRKLFGGNRTWIWLIFPTIYSLFFIGFTNPVVFTSRRYAMFFNPFTDIPGFDNEEENEKVSCFLKVHLSPNYAYFSNKTAITKTKIKNRSYFFKLSRFRDLT